MLKRERVIMHGRWLSTAAVAVVTFVVCVLLAPAWMSFHEQYQLFQSTSTYFLRHLSLPGGVAAYVAQWLVQFFLFPAAGALVMALLLAALHAALLSLARLRDRWPLASVLAVLPVALAARVLADVNMLPALLVAADMALWGVLLCLLPVRGWGRAVLTVVCMPVLYWLCGPVVWMAIACAALLALARRRWLWLGACVLSAAVVALLAYVTLPVQYPVARVANGLFYCRLPQYDATWQWLLLGALALTPALLWHLCRLRVRPVVLCAAVVAVAGLSWPVVSTGVDPVQREVVGYDYLVRNARWDDVVERAVQVPPTRPLSTACVNLALAQRGQLSDSLFHYFQNGPQGLIPPFTRDYIESVTIGEIYYHLGMLNDAQRMAMEAQACVPDGRLSARCMQMLLHTSLLNGNERQAQRYQRWLDNTLFYKHTTKDAVKSLQKASVPPRLHDGDLFYDGNNTEQVLARIVEQIPTHRMAYEYLMAYCLLSRNLDGFMHYFPQGQAMGFDHMPLAYQEALVYVWSQQSNDFSAMPWPVAPHVVQGVMNFARLYVTDRSNAALHEPPLSQTFWSYLLLGPAPAPKPTTSSIIY